MFNTKYTLLDEKQALMEKKQDRAMRGRNSTAHF